LLTTSIHPLGQFLSCDRIRALSRIQTGNERRPLGSRTPHIKRERNQSSILISVELHFNHLRHTVLVRLQVGLEELSGGGRGEREGVGHFGTVGLLAEVAIADCGETDGVWGGFRDEPFRVFDESDCCGVDGWSDCAAGSRGRQAAFEIGGPWTETYNPHSQLQVVLGKRRLHVPD